MVLTNEMVHALYQLFRIECLVNCVIRGTTLRERKETIHEGWRLAVPSQETTHPFADARRHLGIQRAGNRAVRKLFHISARMPC